MSRGGLRTVGFVEAEDGTASPLVVVSGVVVVVALLLGGAAFLRGGGADESKGSATTVAVPVKDSSECDAQADAAALMIEPGVFDYDASESPTDLAEAVDAVLTGQLLSARSGSGAQQASVAVKPGRMELGDGDPPNAFGLPVVDVGRVGQTANFVAFLRTNPAAPGGYEVAVDGLWLACGDEEPAVPVFDHPVGWAEVNSIESIVSRVRDVRRVGQPLEPIVVGDGTTATRVELVDGTTLALYLPESLGTDLILTQDTASRGVAEIQGPDFGLAIEFGFCREENLFLNERGLLATSLLTIDPGEGLVFCRPDEFITMTLNPLPRQEFSPDGFHVIPIAVGDTYQQWLQHNGFMSGQCCFEDRGPMWHDGDMIVAHGHLSDAVTRIDGGSLVPEWTVSLRDVIDSADQWVGDGAFLTAVDERGTIIATTGFGWIVGLDGTTGEGRWLVDLEGQSPSGISRTVENDWLVVADELSEGGASAPQLWRFSGETGEIRWKAVGEALTDPQSDRPQTLGDIVVFADVASHTENPTGEETSHLLAFDLATGERRWTFDLDTRTEGFSSRGTVFADGFRDDPLLLVANIDGVLFRVDPGTGTEIWRNETLPGVGQVQVIGSAPGQITVERSGELAELDLQTGSVLD